MADYGLIVKNSSAQTMIDGNYKNYALKQTSSGGVVFGDNTIDITDVPSLPIFATKADSSGKHCLYRIAKSGSDFVTAWVMASASFTLYWKTFIPGPVQALPTYGLIVRNPSNEVIFSSEDTWLKIKGVYTQSVAAGATSDVTVENADLNYFFLTDFSWRLYTTGSPPVYTYWFDARGFYKLNSTTIRIQTFNFAYATIPASISDSAWTNNCTLIEFAP